MVKGYFTVEAALLFPMIIGTILFVIYSWIFQYDRCLMEMDTGAMVLRENISEIYDEKYVAWKMDIAQITRKMGVVRIERRGELRFPLPGIQFWRGENVWETKAVYEKQEISPVLFVRTYYKFVGGDE